MDELERIRQRKLRELQERQAAARSNTPDPSDADMAEEAARQDAAIESFLQQVLEPEARERLTRIRMSRPDFANKVIQQLAALAQAGRLPGRLTDEQFRQILAQLTPQDRDMKITRR